jgi:hypothetical protein
MRTCVFCGGSPVTCEHVVAERLTKRMGRAKFSVLPGRLAEAEGTQTRQAIRLHAFTVKRVCAACNNRWMNDLESWFEKRLGCLIEPIWPKLAAEMITAVGTERQKLAWWLMKTAAMFDLSGLMKAKVFSSDSFPIIKTGEVGHDLHVELAFARRSDVACTLTRGFQTLNGGVFHLHQIHQSQTGLRFSIQMNHLLLRLMRTPGAVPSHLTPQPPRLPLTIYPRFIAPTGVAFDYADIFEFERALVLRTWLGHP